MQWFLNKMNEEGADYDAMCVFDADNVAMPDFIKAMNKKLIPHTKKLCISSLSER